MRLAKLFFASILFIFGSLFFVSTASAQSFQNPLLFVPFELDYVDYSSNKLYSNWFTGGAPADIDTSIKKFGSASGHFPATGIDREMLYKSPNFDFSNQDFTIDFWWYPTTQSVGFFNKPLLSFWDLNGSGGINNVKWALIYFSEYDFFAVVDYNKGVILRSIDSGGLLNFNQWNHISVQWKQGTGGTDGGSGLGISINGKMRSSNSFYNNGMIPSGVGAMVVGDSGSSWPRVDYYLDELRVTKGTALWGSVANQNGSFTTPSINDYPKIENKTAESVISTTATPMVQGTIPLLLAHFDNNYYDNSINNIYSNWFIGGGPSEIDSAIKKFGIGSGHFSATGIDKENLYQDPRLDLASGDFTVDFWWRPTGDLTSFNKILLSFWGLDANSLIKDRKWYLKYDGSGANPGFEVVNDQGRMLRWMGSDSLLKVNEWNHISLQKKQGSGGSDGGSGLGLSINGYMRPSNSFYNYGTLPGGVGAMVLGYKDTSFPRVDYYIDELRVTKGTALWGNVSNQNGYFAPPTKGDYSNLVVDQNKVTTPVAGHIDTHTVSLGNTTDTTESNVAYSACPPGSTRPSTREEYLIKLDGTPKFTSYLDINNKLICTTYWAGNATTTTSSKLKRFEYDTDGQIAREIYYGLDGASITDVVTYFSKSAGGARQKEIQNRSGTEYYKRYSTTGRLLYEHEYKNSQYVVSRNFTYDGAGRLASELIFNSSVQYEKVVYIRNGSGVVTQTDSYRAYAPIGTDTANYVHTTSTYAGTVVTGITRTYFNKDAGSPTALRTEIARYNTSGVAIDQRTFDYAQNKQKLSTYITTGTASLLGRLKTDEEWSTVDYSYASSSLAYNTTTGELLSWTKTNYDDMSAQGAKAGYYGKKYTVYNPKTGLPKTEDFIDYYLPSLNWKQSNSVKYDEKGLVDARRVHQYRDSAAARFNYISTVYSKDGLINAISKYDDVTGNVLSNETYYGNGEPWYLQKYKYNTAAGQYEVSSFRVNYRDALSTSTASDLVADGTAVNTNLLVFVSQSVPRDPLSQKKIGDKILANISDVSLRGQAEGGTEKLAIRAVLKALLPEYKNALVTVSESDPLKKEKRYEIYVAYSSRISRAIYAIEYRIHNISKNLNTDKSLEDTVVGWYGIDGTDLSGNTEFWGLYIRPGAVAYADPEAVYVDMSIIDPSAVDFATNASSYDDLKSTAKKIEKWDALSQGAGVSYSNSTLSLSLFNLSGGDGRYITLDDMTKADPTVNLTLDRFEEDMKTSGVTLSTLSESALIDKMYEYFNKQSYFSYSYDLSQVSQTVNQTLVRKGGDCEDFGLFFLSLLRGEFARLGNTSITSRLGLAFANVDNNAAISSSNRGGGHASIVYRSNADNQYYYIDASFIFLGSGADPARPVPVARNLVNSAGASTAGVLGQGGWYVKVADFFPINGPLVPFNSGRISTFHDNTSQTNSVDTIVAQVSNIYTKLEPYNPLVTTLASSTVQTIPNFKNQSAEFVVESTHSFFNKLKDYRADQGADIWSGVGQTLPAVIKADGTVNLAGKISGDCEDLAFAEASLLENVLLRYYLAGGAVPQNAANQAKSNVIILAEKNYGSSTGPSHLYVGYVTPKTDTSPAVVRLIDPQLGTIGAPQLMSDLYNDKYLFFSDREKVSAITPYDWSALNFSSAVAAAAANGIVLNPGPVDPKAPVKQNLTPNQQEAIINAIVTADPPKPSAFSTFISFVYEKSGLKSILEASTITETFVRAAATLAVMIGGGPVGTVVTASGTIINTASGSPADKPIIPSVGDAAVSVINTAGRVVASVFGIFTAPGGPSDMSDARMNAEAAFAAGRISPAGPMNFGSGAGDVGCSAASCGTVFVQRNNTTNVVSAIGYGETSRTNQTRSYNESTNVMTITTNTTIVLPLSPYFQSPTARLIPPKPTCPLGTQLCSEVTNEIVRAPANATLSGPLATCYVSGEAPSCQTRQYNTQWSCNNSLLYKKDATGTGCICDDPTATGVSPAGECQYGATISCVGGIDPNAIPSPVGVGAKGVSSFPAPAGRISSPLAWTLSSTAVADGNTECKWSCGTGFTFDAGFCKSSQVFSCTDPVGVTPMNSPKMTLCPEDQRDLSSDTQGVIVTSCTIPKKCEYTCNLPTYTRSSTPPFSCVCSIGTNPDGSCTLPTVTSSNVSIFATPGTKVTGNIVTQYLDTNKSTAINKKITVKKNQEFKLNWEHTTPSASGKCTPTFTSPITGTGAEALWKEVLPTGVNGSKEGLKLDKTGQYIFGVSCDSGGITSADSVTVQVAPSGSFEEF